MAGLIKENKGVKNDAANFNKLGKTLSGKNGKASAGRTGKAATKNKKKFKKAKK